LFPYILGYPGISWDIQGREWGIGNPWISRDIPEYPLSSWDIQAVSYRDGEVVTVHTMMEKYTTFCQSAKFDESAEMRRVLERLVIMPK
jgi:hypothetical protein